KIAPDCCCRSRRSGGANGQSCTFRARSSPHTITSRRASAYGSGRSSTALTTLKIAVQAPMPSAIVIVATAVKPAFFLRPRAAYAQPLTQVSTMPSSRGHVPCPPRADRARDLAPLPLRSRVTATGCGTSASGIGHAHQHLPEVPPLEQADERRRRGVETV